ncbi:MAG: hypothetical protein M3N08_09470, partial [Pseudomonadota bacterium]|nr:hypothetical protein [Pseudomonadota bacterium]
PRIEQFIKQSKELEKTLSEGNMNDKATSGKETAGKENQSSDKTAREKLALSIAAEKRNTDEKQQDKSKGRERDQ